jgi:serine/threonine protein kinase
VAQILSEREPSTFSEPEVANIVTQTLRGLAFLHSKKIIHRGACTCSSCRPVR